MSDPRPVPTMIGLVNTGRAHLAFPDKALSCNAGRSVTGDLKRLGRTAGQDETVAALLALDVAPALVCRRCLPLPQFHARYATAWTARSEAAPQPAPAVLTPVTGGLVEIERRTATGDQHDGACFDCARAFVKDQTMVIMGPVGKPDPDDSERYALHTVCVELRARAWGNPDRADQWTVQPDDTAATVALRAEVERLTARCIELTTDVQQARATADHAEAVSRVQAASLAQLADMAEAARCHSSDFLGDADFYTEGADKRRRNGLRYTMARHTELTVAFSAAARGYTQPKPSDLWYPDLPALLGTHGWSETPARELTMYEDTRPKPMHAKDRRPAWLRVWRRDRDHVAAWFTSPTSLDWISCNTRGRLAELREIEHVITSKDAGRREPAAPPKPDSNGPVMSDGTTIDQVVTIMEQHHWHREVWGSRGFVWTKRGHGLDEHGRPRYVRVYGTGDLISPAVVWYWAGRITVTPQLVRIAER